MANTTIEFAQLDSKSTPETYYTDSLDVLNYSRLAIVLNVENVSGTSPTLDITIQHSMNDADWDDLFSFDQVTAAGKQVEYIPGSSLYGFARYLRAKIVVGGTTPNFTFELTAVAKEG